MAKLPNTIYKKLEELQHTLYKAGYTNGSLSLADVYDIFEECGYGPAAANKWLLNWAVSRRLRFEKDKDYYRVRLGEFFDSSVRDLMDGGRVWLPCKDSWIKKDGKRMGVQL